MNLVEEEMVADNALAVLSDEKAMRELAKDNKTLLQKIGAFFRNLANKLKAIKEKLSKSSIVYSEVNHDIEFLEQSAEKIKTMLDSVKENTSKQNNAVKYSKNTDFPNQVDEWYKNGHNNETFIIGDTGEVLQGLGAVDNQIYFYGSKINSILKKHSNTMSLDIIKKVPEIIDNPALVLASHSRSQENNSRLLMFGMVKDINGKPVMAVLDLQPMEKGLLISDMQKLTSAYSLTRGQKGIYDYLNKCDVLYVTKNEKIATKLVRQIGFVDPKKGLPIAFQQSGYVGNISYSGRSVNIQGVPFSEIFKSDDNANKKFSKKTGYIKNFSQCDRVVESLDKYLSKKYDDTFELNGTKVEFISIQQSYGMGSYATFYIDFAIDETEGITIRYSGHKNSTADYYLWNDDFSSMKEIKKAIDDIVEQEVKIEMPERKRLQEELMEKLNKKGIKFSLNTSVEETKDLVAIHNTTEDKLLNALELGGLPSPSIAVMKAQNMRGNSNFGNISLVFDKSTIDPQLNKNNKVYSGDAYTPVSPRVEYKLNDKIANNLYDKMIDLTKGNYPFKLNSVDFAPQNVESDVRDGEDALIDYYKNDYGMKQAYLADTSEPVINPIKKIEKTVLPKEDTDIFDYFKNSIMDMLDEIKGRPIFGKRWAEKYDAKVVQALTDYFKELIPGISDENIENIFNNSNKFKTAGQRKNFAFSAIKYFENGAVERKEVEDVSETRKLIDYRIDQKEYEKWLHSLFDGIVEKKGIYNGKDLYTPSGNQRSFEQLHWDYTLENIVRAMKNQNAQGGNFLVSNIIGGSAYNYESVDEIKKDKSRLQKIDAETYDKIRDTLYDRFNEIAQGMTKYNDMFAVADVIVEGVAKTKTKSGLAKFLKSELKGWGNYSDMAVDDIWTLVNDIRQLPTEYFEAKPQRAVYFNEVYKAVIPDNSSEKLKTELSNAGVDYAEYKTGDEQSRLDVLNSMESIRFSKNTNFAKALTPAEWKKYNNAIMTGNDNGLCISDNSMLVECENKSEYQYKYVVYDEFEDGQRITDVYAIGKIDTNVEDNVPSQYHNIAEYINEVRDLGYDNRKNIRNLYKNFMRDTSYVLVQYNNNTSKFNVIGRGSVKNGTNTFDKSVGRGSPREDTGRVSSDRGRFSKYSRNTRLNYDENFDDVNEAFEQALNVLQNIKGIDVSSKVVEEVGKAQKNIDKELDGYHAQKMRNSNSVNKVARNLKEEYISSMPTGKLTNMLADLYDYMANGDSTDMAYINSQAKVIANELINSSTSIVESDYKDIRKRITDRSYSLTPETKKSVPVSKNTSTRFEPFMQGYFVSLRSTSYPCINT